GGDLVVKESVRRQLNQMQEELAGPSPTPLEARPVQRVLLAWVQVNFADCLYAQVQKGEGAAVVLRELERRQVAASRCLTEAVRQLQLARRLRRGKKTPVRLAKLDLPGGHS